MPSLVHASEFARKVSELASQGEPFAVATVTRTEGSTLAKVGFKILISPACKVVGGTLGGGCPEGPIVEVARAAMTDGVAQVVRVHLVDTERAVAGTVGSPQKGEIYVETNCGGTMEVFVEPMMPTERLVIVAQGGKDDIEDALVQMGKALRFQVVVVDPVPSLEETPDVLLEVDGTDLGPLAIGGRDYVVVLTKGERDVAILEGLSRTPAKFVGLLASRHRLHANVEELRQRGVSESFLNALHAPIGLNIGAQTPSELALAILGDVIATKYGKDVPHKPLDG